MATGENLTGEWGRSDLPVRQSLQRVSPWPVTHPTNTDCLFPRSQTVYLYVSYYVFSQSLMGTHRGEEGCWWGGGVVIQIEEATSHGSAFEPNKKKS